MSVYQDKTRKTYYYDFKHNGKHYKKRGFRLKSEATDAERLALLSLDKDPKDILTVSELVSLYLQDAKSKIDPDIYDQRKHRCDVFILTFFKKDKASKVSAKRMNDWRIWLDSLTFSRGEKVERKYSAHFKNTIISLLTTVYNFGIKYYDLPKNPTIYIDRFKKKLDELEPMRVWDVPEFEKFIEKIDNQVYKTFFTLLFYTGLRKGEAKGLVWRDIDFEKCTLSVKRSMSSKGKGRSHEAKKPKTLKSYRTIIIDDTTLKMLKELKEYYAAFYDFCDEWYIFGGNHILANVKIDRVKEKAIRESGVPYITIHEFRHSHASFLIGNGFNVVYVSKRLGHSNVETTLRTYTHIIDSVQDSNSALLNRIRGGILGEKSEKVIKS